MKHSVTYAIIDNEIRRPGAPLVSGTLLQFMEDETYKGENPRINLADCLRINTRCHLNGYFDRRLYEKLSFELYRLIDRFKRTDKVRTVLQLHRVGALE